MINQHHTIFLKVLTPVHIGGSQEKHLQPGIDFIKRRGKILRIKEKELYETFDPNRIATALASGDANNIENLINLEASKVTEEVHSEYEDNLEIKANIRNGMGKLIIPGSSIKGAIRSAIYGYLHREHYPYDKSNTKEPDLFGSIRNDNDIFRLLRVSDCSMKSSLIVPAKVFNLYQRNGEWVGGWKHRSRGHNSSKFENKGFTSGFECFELHQVGRFSLKVAKNLYQQYKQKLNLPEKGVNALLAGENPVLNIFSMIKKHTLNHLEKDLKFFQKYNQVNLSQNIIFSIESLIRQCENLDHNSAILRIGSGSGFHSMTGDWQFDQYENLPLWSIDDARRFGLSRRQQDNYVNNYQMFKSRRLAFLRGKNGYDFYPMGFVLLSLDELKEEVIERSNLERSQGETSPSTKDQVKKSAPEEINQPPKEYIPNTIPSKQVKKGAEIDAECLGMDFYQAKFKVYVEGFENEIFKVRYPGGMEFGQKVILKVSNLQGKRFNKGTQFAIKKIIN